MHGNRQYNVAPFFAPPHMPHQIPQPAAERVKPKLTRYNSAWQLRQLAASTQREIGVPQPVPEQHHPAPVNQPSKRYDSAWQLRQLGADAECCRTSTSDRATHAASTAFKGESVAATSLPAITQPKQISSREERDNVFSCQYDEERGNVFNRSNDDNRTGVFKLFRNVVKHIIWQFVELQL
ncbi:hypothetical protein LTR09_004221 [Extremus antarcticus]|uniref:Uncharacterized protein n=1 Tax=Extremus antarcticus TaxID=702011 RepID=A0AAJ0DJC6_9PEZI|nr:hypothetical protein LTR09_004221 [Extremus antarcticus]